MALSDCAARAGAKEFAQSPRPWCLQYTSYTLVKRVVWAVPAQPQSPQLGGASRCFAAFTRRVASQLLLSATLQPFSRRKPRARCASLRSLHAGIHTHTFALLVSEWEGALLISHRRS
eukprot:6205376-Pleurochrysis_carterae.AAC.4